MVDYPTLAARTLGFSLGRATSPTISPDGGRVLFLRSRGPEDPVRCLWSLDLGTGDERLLIDPLALGEAEGPPSAEERIRRERTRDRAAGIAAYTTDDPVRAIAFDVSGHLFVADAVQGTATELAATTPVADPRLSPDGTTVAYESGGALRVIGADDGGDRPLAEPDGPEVTWGLAEHEAAESMERQRGFWWAPGGDRLAVARVDNAAVRTWYLTDPSRPDAEPLTLRYPPAGETNADVSLWILGLDGSRVEVQWDRVVHEYLVDVVWDDTGLLAVVQNRAQTVLRILTVDPATGATSVRAEVTDPAWTTIVPGYPGHTAAGELIWTVDDGDTRRLTVDGTPVTPPGLQIGELLGIDGDTVLVEGSEEPTEWHLWTWSAADGPVRRTAAPGLYGGRLRGGTLVTTGYTMTGEEVTVHPAGGRPIVLTSLAASPPSPPQVTLLGAGARELPTAVLFPSGHRPGSARLPVLMDPYGGPAGQRTVAARAYYFTSQWFADQGFAVVIADGRGVPGRGPRWERTIHRDCTDMILEDQVDALHAVADRYPDLDLGRVAIRGWSAGGYLAALAVLRRPEVFHAAVAGAPDLDQRLYSSHWQERYLGDPRQDPEPYDRNTLFDDAPSLRRPLLLVHGMLDDNVHPAHTMRLSQALFHAGRPHSVLPLPAQSHMISDPRTAASLLRYELRFLLDALSPVRDIP